MKLKRSRWFKLKEDEVSAMSDTDRMGLKTKYEKTLKLLMELNSS